MKREKTQRTAGILMPLASLPSDEGIGWFAAKRGWGMDERALGMEAEMIFGTAM